MPTTVGGWGLFSGVLNYNKLIVVQQREREREGKRERKKGQTDFFVFPLSRKKNLFFYLSWPKKKKHLVCGREGGGENVITFFQRDRQRMKRERGEKNNDLFYFRVNLSGSIEIPGKIERKKNMRI